jgi:hypothetical protein
MEDWGSQGKTKNQYESSGKIMFYSVLICGLILLGYGLIEYTKVILAPF